MTSFITICDFIEVGHCCTLLYGVVCALHSVYVLFKKSSFIISNLYFSSRLTSMKNQAFKQNKHIISRINKICNIVEGEKYEYLNRLSYNFLHSMPIKRQREVFLVDDTFSSKDLSIRFVSFH